MRSVWLRSRDDAMGNMAVMLAALGVWRTATAWPDLIVATIMAGVFFDLRRLNRRQASSEYCQEQAPHAVAAE